MTRYCPHVSSLSKFLWDYMSNVFKYKLPISEIGITNHLVFDIINFYNGIGPYCEAYAIHAPNENLRGADIDLFIENNAGNFHHFMIQAKVMNYNGRYMDIAKWNPAAQFLSLIDAANSEDATALYLLYNGKTANSTLANANYGASIISAETIRDFRSRQRRVGYLHGQNTLYFDLLFPLGIEPYSELFCGVSDKVKKSKEKSISEIHTGYPYVKILKNFDKTDEEDKVLQDVSFVIKEKKLARFRIIIKDLKEN